MTAARTLRTARQRAGLSARRLAARAGTSHATVLAYEAGTKVPRVDTLERLVRAAGYSLDLGLDVRIDDGDRAERGRELAEVLDLAAEFPARHESRLRYPPFGCRP